MGRYVIGAGLLGMTAVALGAFGAHGMERWLHDAPDAARRLEMWQTAVRYQMWHTLLFAMIGHLIAHKRRRFLRYGALCTVVGIVLFSGSLYLYALTGISTFGAVTPVGGVFLMLAWLCLVVVGARAHHTH